MTLDILDVAIGLIFVYLVLSLAVTAANEFFAAAFKRRAVTLRLGVLNLLNDDLTKRVYEHPLIRSLYRPKSLPSYIPSRSFAIALLDSLDATDQPSIARDAVAILKRETGGDVDKLRQAVEEWFNDSMERVAGWYKRRTQIFSLLCAVVITIGTNADTLKITDTLWRDPSLRQAMVAQAQRYVAEQPRPQAAVQPPAATTSSPDAPDPPPLPPYEQAQIDYDAASDRLDATLADINAMQLPIGWRLTRPVTDEATQAQSDAISRFRLVRNDASDDWPGAIWRAPGRDLWIAAVRMHLLGWLITILAISIGAPFWFDTLNRVISIRSVGKAPEESPKAPKDVPKPRAPGEEP